MRQAVVACILWKAYFSAETWWPGRTRPSSKAPQHPILNQVLGHMDKIAKVIQAGARVILPVFCTTPLPALYQESGLLPAETELDYIAASALICLHHLDPYHPLRKQAARIARNSHPNSCFARHVLNLPDSEQLNLLQYPPWLPYKTREDIQL